MLHKSEQMIQNMFANEHKADTFSKLLSHSDDCVST